MTEEIFLDNLNDDIERIIEDGEVLRRDSDRESHDEDKKEQEEKEKEKPKIRKKIGPRPVLNAERLKGPRGLATMEEFFSCLKFDGRKGREEKDLDVFMKQLELWVHRLYPRGQFDDCLKQIAKLGKKKVVMNYIKRIKLGLESEVSDLVRDEPDSPPPAAPLEDPFDQLMSSSSGTEPAVTDGSTNTNHVKRIKVGDWPSCATPLEERSDRLVSSTTGTEPTVKNGSNTVIMTTEQRERMLRNRLIAEERRAARIKKAQELKEKFRAQQALNCQAVNKDDQLSSQNTVDKQQNNSEKALQMEVDDNHD